MEQIYKLIRSAGPMSGGTKVVVVQDNDTSVAVRSLVKNVKEVWLLAETTKENLQDVAN